MRAGIDPWIRVRLHEQRSARRGEIHRIGRHYPEHCQIHINLIETDEWVQVV